MKHEFNINNYVEFVLTSRGAEILNKREKEMSSALPKYIKNISQREIRTGTNYGSY